MTDYGVDVSVLPGGLDLSFGEISGVRVLIEDAVKALTTASGVLWWDPDTLDLRLELLNTSTAREREVLAARVKNILENDPRVRTVSVAVTSASNELGVRVRVYPLEGASFTFSLTTENGEVKVSVERNTTS